MIFYSLLLSFTLYLVIFFFNTHTYLVLDVLLLLVNVVWEEFNMDDVRYLWLRDKVYDGLEIKDSEVFEEFLNRDENENEMKIARFMNQTEEDDDFALIFFKELKEEEIEVQVELSNFHLYHLNKKIKQSKMLVSMKS